MVVDARVDWAVCLVVIVNPRCSNILEVSSRECTTDTDLLLLLQLTGEGSLDGSVDSISSSKTKSANGRKDNRHELIV